MTAGSIHQSRFKLVDFHSHLREPILDQAKYFFVYGRVFSGQPRPRYIICAMLFNESEDGIIPDRVPGHITSNYVAMLITVSVKRITLIGCV